MTTVLKIRKKLDQKRKQAKGYLKPFLQMDLQLIIN